MVTSTPPHNLLPIKLNLMFSTKPNENETNILETDVVNSHINHYSNI